MKVMAYALCFNNIDCGEVSSKLQAQEQKSIK
jgi:hypothetical protein